MWRLEVARNQERVLRAAEFKEFATRSGGHGLIPAHETAPLPEGNLDRRMQDIASKDPARALRFEFDAHVAGRVTRRGAQGQTDRKSTRLNSSHVVTSRMPSSA